MNQAHATLLKLLDLRVLNTGIIYDNVPSPAFPLDSN
jgi:hypothetical protein